MFMNPGDVVITSIAINGLDVTDLIQQLDVYNDLMVPGLNCSLVIIDPANLHGNLPIVGKEMLTLNYATPGLASFVHTFAVSTIEDAKPSTALRVKALKITAVAVEVTKNKETLVDKSYNTTFDAIVSDVFKNFLGSGKPLKTEATQGVQEYIITRERPFDAINKIRKRSSSTANPSSTYLMFEDQIGYNYVTLESLFKGPIVGIYDNSNVGARNFATDINFWTIIGYNVPELLNMTMKIGQGAFGSVVKNVDLKTLLFGTGPYPIGSGPLAGLSSFVPNDLTRPPTYIDQFISRQRAFLAQVDQVKLHLKIYGNSTLCVGQQITVNLIINDDTTNPRQLDNQPPLGIAGNYVIAKIVSTILPTDVSPRYLQILECVSTVLYVTGV
jgi:hypothetical protein